MVSPETDSGFVGSETSIVSPFTQTPEHRLSHVRYCIPPGTSWNLSVCGSPEQGPVVPASAHPHLIPSPGSPSYHPDREPQRAKLTS